MKPHAPARSIAWLVFAAVSSAAQAQTGTPATDLRFDGEYSLYVGDRDDSVVVRWITARPDSGLLEVFARTKLVIAQTTAPGDVHTVRFPRPKSKAAELSLRYGSKSDTATLVLTDISLDPERARPKSVMRAADSIFVMGDVHGMFGPAFTLLRNAGLVTANGEWAGGRAHLVFLGDLFDRGPDVTPLLWSIYRLERSARRKGGSVDVVLGNHEIMTWTNDIRYVAPREMQLADAYQTNYGELFDLNHTVLGRWLASKPGVIQIGDVVMTHGGITPTFAKIPVQRFNDLLSAFVHEPIFPKLLADSGAMKIDSTLLAERSAFFFAEQSPFWYLGLRTGRHVRGPARFGAGQLPRHPSRRCPHSDSQYHVAILRKIDRH